MQNIFIIATWLWSVLAFCEINSTAPKYLYPSLNSPFIINIEEFAYDQNLQFSVVDQVNSTYYYSMTSDSQPIQMQDGIIIASAQYDFDQYNNFFIGGNIALLVQNQTGYYPYIISTNNQEYTINFIGNFITNNIVCYQIAFQNQTILLVSCENQEINQIIVYKYDLEQSPILQPVPFSKNISLSDITNSFISANQEYSYIAYTSLITSQTEILYNYEEMKIFNGQLTDIIGDAFLFATYLFYDYITFGYTDCLFFKMSILYQIRQEIFIATQQSILLVKSLYPNLQFIDKIPYPIGFELDINSKVQLFTDDLYIIISDSYKFLVYEQSNHRLFWQYQLLQQSLIQYDNINKIITMITSQSIQAFQLFKPQIYLYFDQISSGMLTMNLTGLTQNCTYQLEYQVILNNDTGPYVNYYDTNQILNYQDSQIQCLNCLFTGQNLTFDSQGYNIDVKQNQFQLTDLFNNQDFQFYYIYSSYIDPQEYAIFYQIENQSNLYVIYCSLAYCYFTSNYQTLNQTAIINVNGSLNSFFIQYQGNEYDTRIFTFILTYNVQNQLTSQNQCYFQWRSCEFDCFVVNISTNSLPPISNIYIGQIGSFSYYQISDPNYIQLYQQQVQNNLGFVPRQLYYNQLLYNNLVFIDNVYQLTIYELILNGTYLNYVTSIQYPLQEGNTSVGIGLLEKAIVIAQIDDQGNQYIQFYDPIILRTINLIQQPQPQVIQIPIGAQIQFPIVCSYTNSKFYLVWQYNQNSEIAIFQPSRTINNMLLTSIYVNGYVNSIQSISLGVYDILVCKYNQSKILSLTLWNKFFIQLNSNLLLQNDTFKNVSINYIAQYQQQQVSIIKQYTFINEIFKLTQIQDYQELSVTNSLWFKFQISDFYYGLANTYKSNNQQSPLGPFLVSNNFVSVNPVPQLFISNSYQLNSFDIYFQNNSGVYWISNFLSGQIQQVTKFADNLDCPVLFLNQNQQVVSICQSSPTQLIIYSDGVYNLTLEQPLSLVNGFEENTFLILNFGSIVQIIQNNQVICQYINNDISISNVVIVFDVYALLILQIKDSEIIVIVQYQDIFNCQTKYQQEMWIDQSKFGTIVFLNAYFYEQQHQYYTLLTVTTTKTVLVYYLSSVILYQDKKYKLTQIINYSQEMIGIQTKIIDNYIIAIYNTTQNDQLNYSVIVYSLNQVNKIDLPIIAYYNQFIGSPQQFFICQDGILVYTYIYENQTGFSYLQILPYVYVAIDYNNLTLGSQNSTFAINNYLSQVSVGNEFNDINITFNITYTNYIGAKFIGSSAFGTANTILVIISVLSIFGFICFVVHKIQTRNKMG